MADTLATLASNALYPCHVELTIMIHFSIHNAKIHTAENRVESSWISLISNYLRSGALLEERKEAMNVKARATMYALINGILYM